MDSAKQDRLRQLHERLQKETDLEKKLVLVKEFERALDEETPKKPAPSEQGE